MRIESTPSSAVPVSAIEQFVSPGADAVPVAFQLISAALPLENAPSAVPDTCRSPAHVALNVPLADVAVCSVAFHLKLVQELDAGITLPDVQLPSKALTPVAEGPVRSLLRSNPMQPAAAAATANTTIKKSLFICSLSALYRAESALETVRR
jgi:hypothetical protein